MRHPPVLELRNRTAAFGWAFMLVWLAMLALFTWLMARDGPHPSQPAWLQQGALALFWLLGLPAAGYILAKPCTALSIGADRTARLTRRTVFGKQVEAWPPGAIADVELRAGKDEEDDPYWRTFIIGRDGRERLIGEGRLPAEQAALAARLRTALGLP